MKLKLSSLKSEIKSILKENWKNKEEIILDYETSVLKGSPEHLSELKSLLQKMINLRDAQKTGTSNRYAYARSIERLRHQIRKMEREIERKSNVG